MVFILSLGFSILYRKLARVGFEPTTSCLPCTHTHTHIYIYYYKSYFNKYLFKEIRQETKVKYLFLHLSFSHCSLEYNITITFH